MAFLVAQTLLPLAEADKQVVQYPLKLSHIVTINYQVLYDYRVHINDCCCEGVVEKGT
jgi:hypothetical protein